MKISQNAVVEFSYELEVDGQIVDQAPKERPLDYIHGTGGLLPKLEEHIEGMEPGDSFEITLAPEDAYGEVDPQRVIDLPKAAFEVNGEIREDLLIPGNVIPMLNSMGAVIPGKVLEVTEESVKMDLNHQMAGKTLHFKGEVLTVREATEGTHRRSPRRIRTLMRMRRMPWSRRQLRRMRGRSLLRGRRLRLRLPSIKSHAYGRRHTQLEHGRISQGFPSDAFTFCREG